jgi:hypothetical protein
MTDIINDDNDLNIVSTWHVVRTYNARELEVSAYFESNNIIPYSISNIHNILFLPHNISADKLREVVTRCPIPITLLMDRSTQQPYEIQEKDILNDMSEQIIEIAER